MLVYVAGRCVITAFSVFSEYDHHMFLFDLRHKRLIDGTGVFHCSEGRVRLLGKTVKQAVVFFLALFVVPNRFEIRAGKSL